ncbi:MAG: hypothetical protein HQL23_01605 [Candidatus Omnitrophica bacterium]|nr:hypothetical protein [Candidatus Omnitrophota bacterium]
MRRTLCLVLLLTLTGAVSGWAAKGRLASKEEINFLKKDLLDGKIKVGETRLKQISSYYGDAADVLEQEKKITYNYGDFRIEFSKQRYFRSWQYDFSHQPGYSKDINKLRKDLESQQVTGEWLSLIDDIIKDYKNPTEAFPASDDGEISVYYWGELRLTFENYFVVSAWKADKLDKLLDSDSVTADTSLQSKPVKETAKPADKKAEKSPAPPATDSAAKPAAEPTPTPDAVFK